MVSIYFISLASNEENLFDIFHAAHLKQAAFYRQDLYIVGIASDYDEALEMTRQMVEDIYQETGGFRVRNDSQASLGYRLNCRPVLATK